MKTFVVLLLSKSLQVVGRKRNRGNKVVQSHECDSKLSMVSNNYSSLQNRWTSGAVSETRYMSAECDHKREVQGEKNLSFCLALRTRGHIPCSCVAFCFSVSLSALLICLFCRLQLQSNLYYTVSCPLLTSHPLLRGQHSDSQNLLHIFTECLFDLH